MSRIYLDNVPNIQASWVTQGLRMGQVALAFGANDMGSTMIEENVVAAAGVRNQCDVDEMVRLIRAAGRTPVQRDTLYGEVGATSRPLASAASRRRRHGGLAPARSAATPASPVGEPLQLGLRRRAPASP